MPRRFRHLYIIKYHCKYLISIDLINGKLKILINLLSDNNYKAETIINGYETTMRLIIRGIRPQDYGSFRCIATNSLGETDGKIKLYSKYF